MKAIALGRKIYILHLISLIFAIQIWDCNPLKVLQSDCGIR